MYPFTVVVVDNHKVVRTALRWLIEGEPTLRLIGEAGDGPEAIRAVHTLQPDLVLMDIRMPGMSGLEVLQFLRNERDAVAIVLLSWYDDPVYVEAAMRLGATAFVAKEAGYDALMSAIHTARYRAFSRSFEFAPFVGLTDDRLVLC